MLRFQLKKPIETTAWTLLYVSHKTFFHKDCALTLAPDCRVWGGGEGAQVKRRAIVHQIHSEVHGKHVALLISPSHCFSYV